MTVVSLGAYTNALTQSENNIFNVLTQTTLNIQTEQSQTRLQLVQNQLNAQFQQKIAAAQANNTDSAQESFLQVQISGLGAQKAAFSQLQTQYGTNANILADVTLQLNTASTAATNGDSAGFDSAIQNANADIANLTAVQLNPAFQVDGVATLKTNGIGIQSSAAYGLSTQAGQQAAIAAITSTQTQIAQVTQVTTDNQTLAGSETTALSSQVESLTNTLQNDQFSQSVQLAATTLQLKTQLNTQLRLIEFNLGNTQSVSTTLQNQEQNLSNEFNAPAPGSLLSIFG